MRYYAHPHHIMRLKKGLQIDKILQMSNEKRHLPESEILAVAEKSLHKTLGQLGIESYTPKPGNKGGVGNFIEEGVYGIEPNNDPEPDFIDAGIELKSTPVVQNANGTWSSKERLVLNMIDYFDEASATFETSSFYHKNRRLLIWFYHYLTGRPKADFEITAYDIFEFEHSKEYAIIKRDWDIIHKKIVDGKAHEISESDTTFLAACTKGVGHGKTRKQPFSSIPAKPRAYSFKGGFMSRVYRELIHKMATSAPHLVSDDEWMKDPLEEIYKERFEKFHGLSISDLQRLFMYRKKPKDLTRRLVQRMLGLGGNDMQTQEMEDAGIKFKTVRFNRNGVPHEAMSFPAFDFTELINTDWDDSEIRDEFCEWKIMFAIFRDDKDGVCRFDKVLFWNVPNKIVDGPIKVMYEEAARLIASGDAFEFDKDGEPVDRFPKEKKRSNGVCHIRPHGRDGADKIKLPVKDKVTGITEFVKPSFWFNRDFIKKTIEELENLD